MQVLSNMVNVLGTPGTVTFAVVLVIALGMLMSGVFKRMPAPKSRIPPEKIFALAPMSPEPSVEDRLRLAGEEVC